MKTIFHAILWGKEKLGINKINHVPDSTYINPYTLSNLDRPNIFVLRKRELYSARNHWEIQCG